MNNSYESNTSLDAGEPEEQPDKKYTIALDSKTFFDIETADEPGTKYKKFVGQWLPPFLKKMIEYENETISLRARTARINETGKTSASNFFSATAVCNQSKDCPLTYSLKIKKKPKLSTKTFIEIEVSSEFQHKHEEVKKKQIRGEERVVLAEKVIAYHGGSATAAVNKMLCDNMLAGKY